MGHVSQIEEVEQEHVQKFGIAGKYLGQSFEISRYLSEKIL
jgi:hypothetical protein